MNKISINGGNMHPVGPEHQKRFAYIGAVALGASPFQIIFNPTKRSKNEKILPYHDDFYGTSKQWMCSNHV